MAAYLNKLQTKLMLGVGTAFDVHTGGIVDAPAWVKSAGLTDDPDRDRSSTYMESTPGESK